MKITINYPYLASASINACFNRGDVRKGLKSEVRAWKEGLSLVTRNELQQLDRDIVSPVSLRFHLFVPKTVRVVDCGNFSKIIEDAIFDVLPFDDNDKHLSRGPYTGSKENINSGFFAIILSEIPDLNHAHSISDWEFFKNALNKERINFST